MIELPSTEAAAMSEALKIALTALVGVVVFVIGQIAVKSLIEPLHDQKKLIGEITGTIIFYSNVGAGVEQYYYDQIRALAESQDPQKAMVIERYKDILRSHWSNSDEASRTLRRQATELLGKTRAIPLYGVLSFLGVVHKPDDVIAASSQLIGMSNSTHKGSFGPAIENIVRHLNLKIVAKQQGISPR
jgi:hypothetical protein